VNRGAGFGNLLERRLIPPEEDPCQDSKVVTKQASEQAAVADKSLDRRQIAIDNLIQ
jgi:hypothetical protein